MKITRRDLGVILVLIGLIAVFVVYRTVFTTKQTEIENLEAQEIELREKIAELQAKKDNEQFYLDEIARMSSEVSDIMGEFPSKQLYEDGIMYLNELEETFDVRIPTYTVTESSVISTTDGTLDGEAKSFSLASASVAINCTVSDYDEMKNLIDYIYSDENVRRDIQSVSFSMDNSTGEITMDASYNVFSMNDNTREYEEQKLEDVELSVENIFGEVVEEEEE